MIFWLLILIKGIISRKIKLPYVWGLYFSISYTFFFLKRIISDTATDRTLSIIGILFLIMLLGIYRLWSGKMSWETIEKSWSIDALDNFRQVKGKGLGLTEYIVKTFGKRNTYYTSIVIIFIFPLACFVL
ncbi:hypothetical protein N9V16_01850 [SAR116 cluster bacterium]|nr:hypothetical protein [SAR116 cluster bacterium]